jgi:hypothetical protein
MSRSDVQASDEETPVFGLTKADLWPIVEEAAGETVVSFDIRMEDKRPEPYGFTAEKEIPTFAYVTKTGRAGRVTVFVKRFHRMGVADHRHLDRSARHIPAKGDRRVRPGGQPHALHRRLHDDG